MENKIKDEDIKKDSASEDSDEPIEIEIKNQ